MKQALFAVLALLGLSVAFAQEAVLMAHKEFTDESAFAQGQNLTITIHVYNVGEGAAFDVDVNDPWSPEHFAALNGSTTAHFDKVAAGEHVKNTFTISPTVHGQLKGFPAVITYRPTEEASKRTALSSSFRNVTVLPSELFRRYTAKHYEEWSVFYTGIGMFTLLPLLVYISSRVSHPKGVPEPVKKDGKKSL